MDTNTFALDSREMSVADAQVSERMLFLRKTYSLVLLGMAVFAVAMLSYGKVEFLTNATRGIYSSGPWIPLAVVMGGGWLVGRLATMRVIGFVGFLLWTGLLGLMVAPLAAVAGPSTTGMAAVVTLAIFVGLTTYVFVTKKDFSWLGGALSILFFSLLGIAAASWIFGFHVGSWYGILGALLYSGYILYHTSDVMRRSRVEDSVPAAVALTTDVILLFWNLLAVFASND